MKSFKTLAASLLALGFVGATSAQTVIRVTGSTAFRNATEQAIEVALQPGFTWGGVGGLVGKTQLIFNGHLASGGDAVIILTAFTGSEGGVFNLTHPSTPPSNATYILHDSAHLSQLTTSGFTGFTSSDATDNLPANVTMVDTFQSSSAYTTPTLSDTQVGIVPFLWVANPADDPLVGLTHQQAKAALAGVATFALWNNAASTRTFPVLVIGRDQDSGTRDNTFLESGYGNFTPPVQYEDVIVNSALQLYPANTVNGVSYPAGQSGYPSGGNVAAGVSDPNIANIPQDVIGYIGTGDAIADLESTAGTAAGTNPLTPLQWDGVTFATKSTSTSTDNFASIYNEAVILSGQYTFWSYEHLMTVTGTLPTDIATFKSALVTELTTGSEITNNSSGYKLSDVTGAHLARATDGAPVFFTQ